MTIQTKRWLHGLMAAFVGGFASFIETSLILPAVAPESFNFGPNLFRTVFTIVLFGALAGAKLAFAYLAKSPTPPDEDAAAPAKANEAKAGG